MKCPHTLVVTSNFPSVLGYLHLPNTWRTMVRSCLRVPGT